MERHIAILGAGNIGSAIARGLVAGKVSQPADITLTRRRVELLSEFVDRGYHVERDNIAALAKANIVILAVEPQQLAGLCEEIRESLDVEQHLVLSVVSGASLSQLHELLGANIEIIRAMPNTAIAVRESMTCLVTQGASEDAIEIARELFDAVGKTALIDEELMASATALAACGVAFFLRAIRAASQGGIEIGFRSEDAIAIAAQTAKGAASLLVSSANHPEREIDKVTTPRGCTIAGLNRMEHGGFSSALIQGITLSAANATKLYTDD